MDYEMNDFMSTLMSRISIRKYKPEQIPDEILAQILYSASFSPNAGNRQSTQMVICQNEQINDKLGRLKRSLSSIKVSSPGNYISTDQPSIADDPNIPSAFYDAPTVITLFAPKNFWFKAADCYIMANNICLAAYSMGIGSCIVGCVENIFDTEPGKAILQEWNIRENYEAVTHITLGYPATDFPPQKPRKYPEPIVIR
ncbi:MAG: nitroreductase family protein [Lachnospiraceae bacterium]|nr:nitroreductase family protein [Lachnospiraceae bacterium]